MFRISLFFLFVSVVAAQTARVGAGRDGTPSESTVMSGNSVLKSGAVFVFRSVLRPAVNSKTGLGAGGIFSDSSGDTIHRYMIDESSGSYFGYDVVLGTPNTAGAYLVTFRPLSHVEQIDGAASLKLTVLPKYPAPRPVRNGETLELDLMVSPDGTRKLVDIITIRFPEPPPTAAKANAAARDFTVDDGPVTFEAAQWTFWKQGQKYDGPAGFTGKPGATLWIAIPGQGRYILSLSQHEGFTRSGMVRDSVVAFEDAGQRYELRFQNAIAGVGKAWNLYVMHDVNYRPDAIREGMVSAGTDRLDNLLAK